MVVFDEAHNLVDLINQMNSLSIPVSLLEAYAGGLKGYLGKPGIRLSSTHQRYLQQLILILERIVEFLKSSRSKAEVVLTLNEFIHSCGIDHVNVLPIEAYIRTSNLSPKLPVSKDLGDLFGLGRVMEWLVKILTEPAEDGRILLLDQSIIRYISLSPSRAMMQVVREAGAVILAGGTMSPMEEMIGELFDPKEVRVDCFSCGHLIGPDRCLVVPLGVGPSGRTLSITANTRSDPQLIREVGQCIANFCAIVPAGLVVFLPSHAYLRECVGMWGEQQGIFGVIERRKMIFVESNDNIFEDYRKAILEKNLGAILFAVVGGRLSEGINFSNDLGRMVIIVGMPFPDPTDPETRARGTCNNNNNNKENHMLSRCMRSVNQSIGRVIRHAKDYGAVVLLDERYAKQSSVQSRLPGWIQQCMVAIECGSSSYGMAHSRIRQFFRQF